jgi:hypothetical protein
MKNVRLIAKVLLHLLVFLIMCVAIVCFMSTSIDLRNHNDNIDVILGWFLFALTLVLTVAFIYLVAIRIAKTIKYFNPDFNQNL